MKFKTHQERMQHPQASLIPQFLWDSPGLFNGSLNHNLLPLMACSDEEIITKLNDSVRRLTTLHLKKLVWLSIALTHPQLGFLALQDIAALLDLKPKDLFKLLVLTGNKSCLETFMNEQSTLSIETMIQKDDFGAYRCAASNGHLEVLKHLEEKAPQHVQAMIQAINFSAYRQAAEKGHLEVLKHLEEKAPQHIQAMIEAINFSAYRQAAEKGHLEVLKHLEEKAPQHVQAMIQADYFSAYRYGAASNGHLEVLKHLEEKAPQHVQAMIQAKNFSAYRYAALNGHIEVLKHLEEKTPQDVQAMIQADDFGAYRQAAQGGHVEILKYLEEKAPQDVQTMIQAGAYYTATRRGHLGVLKHLEEKAPEHIQAMIQIARYAYHDAAEEGHLEVLKHLEEKAPRDAQAMIQANNFDVYRHAARGGHVEVLKHLEEKAPQQVQTMIQAKNFEVYRKAAENGDLEVLKHLEEKAPQHVQAMIEANSFEAYRKAAEKGHIEVSQRMLTQSSTCFAYAERHVQEYQHVTEPVMQNLLDELHRTALGRPANVVFDIINPEQAKICFYIMRNFIRRNDRAWDDEIRFLLNIPSVKALAHRAVTPRQDNELLRLALSSNNQDAVRILLTIPAVRRLAEDNNYYRLEAHQGIDINRLTGRESSMTALTQGEQKRLEAAIKQYQPILEREDVSKLMDELRAQLKARYEKNPASIQDEHGNTIVLPMEFEDLQALKLSNKDYQSALTAYYQHKDHSAWRYLSKPNRWMNPHASYVYVDEQGRYSTFEEYQPLITMLWLAARDASMSPTEGMTLEGRLEHFVDELALIGRAHNWDEKRVNSITDKEEEYDDLSGDRPSCFSGVKRRLFQSVIGHPLITVLTQDMILDEIRIFVREHFIRQITLDNQEKLKEAFEDFCLNTSSMQPENQNLLESLNITPEQQQEFELYLTKKYGEQYAQDPGFRRLVHGKLTLIPKENHPECNCHALLLDGLVHFYDMLSQPKPEPAKTSQGGLFSRQATQQKSPINEALSNEDEALTRTSNFFDPKQKV